MSRNAPPKGIPFGGALRDILKDDCEGDCGGGKVCSLSENFYRRGENGETSNQNANNFG